MIKDTDQSYGFVTRVLHWVMAFTIIGLIAVGLWMTSFETPTPTVFKAYMWHKQIGIVILILAFIRIGWRLTNPLPAVLGETKPWEKFLARLIHVFFYLCFLLMPLTGWLMSSAKGFPVGFFGLTLPDLIDTNKELSSLFVTIHQLTAYALIAGITLHLIGALRHHFILKDATLKRMLRLIVVGLFLFSFPAQAKTWQIDKSQSRVGFSGTQAGANFTGEFKDYTATIVFDPDDLGKTDVRVEIVLTSIDSDSPDRDQTIQTEPWFNSTAFPQALFQSNQAKQVGDSSYVLIGTLTIKDITQNVELPFTFQEQDGVAHVKSTGYQLNRIDFGLGATDWKDPSAVGHLFPIILDLVAH